MSKKIEFLISLGNLIRTGAVKNIKQAMDFAKQQFGKVDQSFVDDIVNVFKKEGKTKKGEVVPIKKKEGIKTLPDSEKYDQSLFEQKGMGILKKSLEKQKKELEKATELEKLSSELLEEAKNRKIVKKRTDDIATGDPTGETSDPITKFKETQKTLKKLLDELNEMGKPIKNPRRPGGPLDPKIGIVRAAVREILSNNLKAGKINIPDAAEKEAIERYMANKDPIDIFRKTYGEDALEAIDGVADNLLEIDQSGGSLNDLNKFLQDNKLFDFVPKKTYGYDESIVSADKILKQAEQDAKNKKILEDFDPKDRTENADGGIIGNLRLNRTGYGLGSLPKLYKTGQGKFTKAQILIQRLENTIKEYKGKTDELATYVLETFPNFIKELKANPKLANNENVWKQLGQDLPSDQELVVYGDDTVDFFRQTEGPGNIERVTKFLEKNPFLNREEAIKIMKMEPTDQVMEVERLKTIRTKKYALGGKVQMADGGLINILKL